MRFSFLVDWFSCGSVMLHFGASWFSSWLLVIRVWFSCGSVVVHVGVSCSQVCCYCVSMTWFSNVSVCGWLVIMVWFILVHHAFQFVGGVIQLGFSFASFRRIMVQQLAACD